MKCFLIILFSSFVTFAFSQTETEAAPFTYVEKMASFPGGPEALDSLISSNLKYPEESLKNKIGGQVTVQFVVGKDGATRPAKVTRGIGFGCDEEALRVVDYINESHKWEPATHNGRAIPVTYTLNINFAPKGN